MTEKPSPPAIRLTRQESALAATDRASREIIQAEAEARRELTERLRVRRLERERIGAAPEET
jgi:hypothetical protein